MARKKTPSAFDVDLSPEELTTLGGDLARDIDDAFNARSSVIADGGLIDLADWFYEQGRSNAADLPFPGAADLTSYFITENVDALRARLMKAIFGVRPFCFVEGWGDDAAKAPKVEEFTDWQARKSGLKPELGKAVHGALIEDCYILEVSERVETKKIVETMDVAIHTHPDTGGPILEPDAKGVPQPKLKFDSYGEPVRAKDGEHAATVQRTSTKPRRLGPKYDAISMKDFVFLPGHAKSRAQTWGYAYRFWSTLADLTEKVQDGIYDAAAVAELGTQSDRDLESTSTPVDNIAPQYDPSSTEKELFQLCVKRDFDGDGRAEYYVATVSTKYRTILRLQLDTFMSRLNATATTERWRCVPFVLFPRRNSVYGYSYAFTKLLTLAEEHTATRNMTADRSALATNAPIQQAQGGLWDPEAQPIGVGRVITVRDAHELTVMQIPDVPASAIQREQMLHMAKERVGGLSDTAVGVLSNEHRTLGENKLAAGGSAVRVDEVIGNLHLAIAEVMAVSHAIWEDTLKADPRGLRAPKSLQTRLAQRGTEFGGTFTADDLTGEFAFEPYGSDDTADPERRKQNFATFTTGLTNLAKAVPGLAPVLTNKDAAKAILEQLLRDYDIRDRQPFMDAFDQPPAPAPGQADPMALKQLEINQKDRDSERKAETAITVAALNAKWETFQNAMQLFVQAQSRVGMGAEGQPGAPSGPPTTPSGPPSVPASLPGPGGPGNSGGTAPPPAGPPNIAALLEMLQQHGMSTPPIGGANVG
jgi:hypothetical protein